MKRSEFDVILWYVINNLCAKTNKQTNKKTFDNFFFFFFFECIYMESIYKF